jgi:hypothetical protein
MLRVLSWQATGDGEGAYLLEQRGDTASTWTGQTTNKESVLSSCVAVIFVKSQLSIKSLCS